MERDEVVVHRVRVDGGAAPWTHVEDLDEFYTRVYRYYVRGGFAAACVSDALRLAQFAFVVFLATFLAHCVDYPLLFGHDSNAVIGSHNLTFSDVVYASCASRRVPGATWCVVALCALVGCARLALCCRRLYRAYDTKLFYNVALKIADDDLAWMSWRAVQARARDAQRELQMCVHKRHIAELDIYHRVLRRENYLVAMVNKRLLPLHVSVPGLGDYPYLSEGLKYNLELLLFRNPWSPWENRWQLRDRYKDPAQRLALAKRLERHFVALAALNLALAPLVLAWQVLYFFLSHAELVRRSPETLGLRAWSAYARVLLRHFNELEHELGERLGRAHKPATKYLASFPSPVTTIVAKNLAFFCGSILGVLIALSLYDESVLTIEHALPTITALGCAVAIARGLIPNESARRHSGEELLARVLSHVHYLPADWRGRAHTKTVAAHFERLFQLRATSLLIELVSPLVCPLKLYAMRSRALDIVDFYRNFTVSVLDIGDVCSFALMDVRRHGNPDWPADETIEGGAASQYYQGEDGKTELSLVAFSCRNPGWRAPHVGQREFLKSVHDGVLNASLSDPFGRDDILSSYQRNNPAAGLSRSAFYGAYAEADENEEEKVRSSPVAPDRAESLSQEERDLSMSMLHMYDVHAMKLAERPRRAMYVDEAAPRASAIFTQSSHRSTNEDTPLLRKNLP